VFAIIGRSVFLHTALLNFNFLCGFKYAIVFSLKPHSIIKKR